MKLKKRSLKHPNYLEKKEMTLYLYLHKIGLLKLTKKKVERWDSLDTIDRLIFALENGMYDIRILAARKLGEQMDKRAIPALKNSLKDKVKKVSIESAIALKKISNSPELEEEVKMQLRYWEKKEAAEKEEKRKQKIELPKWRKRDWTAIVKKQLQKPMRW